MVSVLAIVPRLKTRQRAIKIRSMPSLGGEVKPSAHVVRFYAKLNIPAEYDRDTMSAKFKNISR
jgi:hypothetical protein